MKFNDAAAVDQIAYEMRLADWPRSQDRARINNLFNGLPPYTPQEAEENGVAINVNFLEPTVLGHDARMQYSNLFLNQARFFSAKSDMGARHKRADRSDFVTMRLARIMKRSLVYFETNRSRFACDVLHGIGPAGWDTEDLWCPDAIGVEDVLVPANTRLHMKNLPFFICYHSYTGPELKRLTRDRKRAEEAGWNMGLVDKCFEWIDRETMALSHNNWPETWSPEKMAERVKGDGGFYAADSVPTIDCFDFYFWDDDEKTEGWKRRIILDAWSTPQSIGGAYEMHRDTDKDWGRNQFLFTSKDRKVATSWQNIVSWQFADLSAVGPFNYHSTRGLGYLMYAIGNLQNRLRCRFSEAVWEATLMYLRVKSADDVQRALKVELQNRGFIDESVSFVPAAERFQINTQLVELGLRENQEIINRHSASYTQNAAQYQDKTERTKFEVMARIQAMTAMISIGQQQACRYQDYEDREIFRRFMMPNSRDPDVNEFRAACLTHGIPEKMLVPEAWYIEHERVLGAGNKTLEMAVAQQLMEWRPLYDPEPQRDILRISTRAITNDPGLAESLVPSEPVHMSDSVLAAQLASAALLQGLPVGIKTGINHIEYIDAMLVSMQVEIGRVNEQGGMPSADKLVGIKNLAQHLVQHIQIVAQDEAEKARVAGWQKQLTKMLNIVRAFEQRLQEAQQQAAQQGNGGADPKEQAKLQAIQLQAQAKVQNTRESHAQRTAQRQIQFEMEQKREDAKLQRDLAREEAKAQVEHQARMTEHVIEHRAAAAKHHLDIAAERRKQRMKSTEE